MLSSALQKTVRPRESAGSVWPERSALFADPMAELTRLRHVMQVLPNGVVQLDARGMVIDANPVAQQMLGQPLCGLRWVEIIQRSFRPRSDDGMEVSLHDGRRVKLAISALEPYGGQLIVLTDLTETRRLQSRVAQMQRLSSLGRMMATLAHQIRTPLSSALLYAQNLTNQKLLPAARAQFVQKLVQRLLDLEKQVNDLLLFARSGREQQAAPIPVQELLGQVEQQVEAQLQQSKVRFERTAVPSDWQLFGNQPALLGAVTNLVMNAAQHCRNDTDTPAWVQLSANCTSDHHLVLSVDDNGVGVPAAQQQQVFEPFFTTRANGTGLGLAVVQAVAASHQGEVRCTDSPLGGARFEIILPLYHAVAADSSAGKES